MGAKDKLKMMISWGNNPVLSVANHETTAESLKEIPYIIAYDIINNEFTEGFADIVLPATCYLEEEDCEGLAGHNYNHAFGLEDWCCHIVQPVVPLKGERRQWEKVLIELVDRLSIKEMYINPPSRQGSAKRRSSWSGRVSAMPHTMSIEILIPILPPRLRWSPV